MIRDDSELNQVLLTSFTVSIVTIAYQEAHGAGFTVVEAAPPETTPKDADLETPRKNLHVAVIMDGNGRWAQQRGWSRTRGHRAGLRALRRVIGEAPQLGVGTLTLYAFSCDNWKRPRKEVQALFKLMDHYLKHETDACREQGIRLQFIGRRDRLDKGLLLRMTQAETATKSGDRLHLRIAVDYSARWSLDAAAKRMRDHGVGNLEHHLKVVLGDPPDSAPLDLIIRTGGERRLSDFLLWEAAYAELWFSARFWPDFGRDDLEAALVAFHGRERRFGGLCRKVG